jgi:ribosomal protein S18 acetylase RimI-like enzyme
MIINGQACLAVLPCEEDLVSLRLERIAVPTPAQFDELFAVCRQAPNYWMLTEGKQLPGRDAIERWFDGSDLPAGRTALDNHIFGIRDGEELIGVVMVLRGWRYPEQATIGLLLLAERCQGRGYGREVCMQVEEMVRSWPGMATMRIGVISTNEPAFPFWHKMGYLETGERKRDMSFIADIVILEKSLYAASETTI